MPSSYITDSEVRNYREDFTNPVINSSDSRDLSRKFPEGLIREKISRTDEALAAFQTPVFIIHIAYSAERLTRRTRTGLLQLATTTGGSATFCRSMRRFRRRLPQPSRRLCPVQGPRTASREGAQVDECELVERRSRPGLQDTIHAAIIGVTMANVAMSFGVVLIVLGIAGYFGSGMISWTALIPAAFGLVLLGLGVIARDPRKSKHAMHVAAMIGVLGFLGSARGLGNLIPAAFRSARGTAGAVIAQSDDGHPDVIFTFLCVRSFINARRNRTI